jgi:hypothetical protein
MRGDFRAFAGSFRCNETRELQVEERTALIDASGHGACREDRSVETARMIRMNPASAVPAQAVRFCYSALPQLGRLVNQGRTPCSVPKSARLRGGDVVDPCRRIRSRASM